MALKTKTYTSYRGYKARELSFSEYAKFEKRMFKRGQEILTQLSAQESLERWFPNRMLRSVFLGK